MVAITVAPMPAQAGNTLDVLFIEDSETDTKLVVRELHRCGFAPRWERVETAAAFEEALRRRRWHLVLSDSSAPRLRAPDALALAKELAPEVPFIVVSGNSLEGAALELLRAGAADHVSKGELHRLGAVVARELARPSALAIRESERHRIARQLHDEVGQLLVAARLRLDAALTQGGVQRTKALREARAVVEETLERVRSFSIELWPVVLEEGVEPALRWLARRHAQWLAVELDLGNLIIVPRFAGIACFRIVQEALSNAARHAAAHRARVRVYAAGGFLEVSVADDGIGYDPRASHGLGLAVMRERVASLGGDLEIESAPSRGTTVRARFPLRA